MDELQISGRRFISSRRAAKDNGYHTDYIGQLIRGGKVKGQKVGRAWYVDAESWSSFLNGEEPIQKLSTAQPTFTPTSSTIAPIKKEIFVAESEPTPAPSTISKEVLVPVEAKKMVVSVRDDSETHPVKISAGLTYVADSEPLLPEISAKPTEIVQESSAITMRMPIEDEEEVVEDSHGRGVAGLIFAGIAVFILSAVLSSGLLQNIKVQANNPASVGYTLHW